MNATIEAWVQRGLIALFFQLLGSVVVLAVAWLGGRHLRDATRRGVMRARSDAGLALFTERIVGFAVIALAFLSILNILGINWTGLVAVVGAIGLAISLAMQDVLKNLFAGMYLLLERPFQIGDRIDIRTYSGHVEDVRLRVTVLRTVTGLQIVVPNSIIFTEAITNRSAYQQERVIVRIVQAGGEDLIRLGSLLVRATGVLGGVLAVPPPEVSFVSMTREKQTFDLAFWTSSRAMSIPAVLTTIRLVLPDAELTLNPTVTA